MDPFAKVVIWGLDHESAYRQLPALEPNHTWVVLPTPEGVTLWRHTVLMFGSVASVWSYCRIADLMGWLCRACLFTPALHFVDDFGSAEDDNLALSSFDSSRRLCQALGFAFKKSKEQPPDSTQTIQGVTIAVADKEVTVRGTEDRRRRLDEALVDVLTQDRLRPHEAASLAGKSQLHICLLRWSLRHASPKSFPFEQEPHSVLYADAFFNLFEKDWRPSDEDIPQWGRTPPETLRNGWGFVLTVRGQTFFAHGSVPYWFVREFSSRRAYIYIYICSRQVVPLLAMQDTIDKFVIMFVDNEPARHALTKGFGKDDSINCLLQYTWRRIEDLSLRPAWQRVTSSANVSDAVSRGDLRHARAEGWTEVQLDWDALFEELLKGSEAFRASGVL